MANYKLQITNYELRMMSAKVVNNLLISKFAHHLIRPANRDFGIPYIYKLVGVGGNVLYIHYITLINAYKYRIGELAVYVFEINPRDVAVGEGVDNHVIFQCFYI